MFPFRLVRTPIFYRPLDRHGAFWLLPGVGWELQRHTLLRLFWRNALGAPIPRILRHLRGCNLQRISIVVQCSWDWQYELHLAPKLLDLTNCDAVNPCMPTLVCVVTKVFCYRADLPPISVDILWDQGHTGLQHLIYIYSIQAQRNFPPALRNSYANTVAQQKEILEQTLFYDTPLHTLPWKEA